MEMVISNMPADASVIELSGLFPDFPCLPALLFCNEKF